IPRVYLKADSNYFPIEEYFKRELFNVFQGMAFKGTNPETIEDFIFSITIGNSNDLLNELKTQKTTANVLVDKLRSLNSEDSRFLLIKNLYVGLYLNDIIFSCNRYLQSYFSSVKYIAPIRASAERYYRIQGLS